MRNQKYEENLKQHFKILRRKLKLEYEQIFQIDNYSKHTVKLVPKWHKDNHVKVVCFTKPLSHSIGQLTYLRWTSTNVRCTQILDHIAFNITVEGNKTELLPFHGCCLAVKQLDKSRFAEEMSQLFESHFIVSNAKTLSVFQCYSVGYNIGCIALQFVIR